MANDTPAADVKDDISAVKSSEDPSSNNVNDDNSTGSSSESDARPPLSPRIIRKRACFEANIAIFQVAHLPRFSWLCTQLIACQAQELIRFTLDNGMPRHVVVGLTYTSMGFHRYWA